MWAVPENKKHFAKSFRYICGQMFVALYIGLCKSVGLMTWVNSFSDTTASTSSMIMTISSFDRLFCFFKAALIAGISC